MYLSSERVSLLFVLALASEGVLTAEARKKGFGNQNTRRPRERGWSLLRRAADATTPPAAEVATPQYKPLNQGSLFDYVGSSWWGTKPETTAPPSERERELGGSGLIAHIVANGTAGEGQVEPYETHKLEYTLAI